MSEHERSIENEESKRVPDRKDNESHVQHMKPTFLLHRVLILQISY
jgi:hypothetical protein